MSLNAGELDRQFTIQRPSGLEEDYADVETGVWGSKRFATGNEVLRGSTPAAQVTHVIKMRYRDDLRASWRLVEEDTSPAVALQIVTFGDPDGRREELKVFVVELI